MAASSNIEWTDASWNCLAGCEAVSPGCANCYAAGMTRRLEAMGQKDYAGLTTAKHFNGRVRCLPDKLDIPLRWKKPRRVFVNSMSDLFHEDVPDEFIDKVFAVMALCPQHTFQVLTKRPQRMLDYFAESIENGFDSQFMRWGAAAGCMLDGDWIWNEGKRFRSAIERFIGVSHGLDENDEPLTPQELALTDRPLFNVWLGVSVEDQQRADERIPLLLQTPAAVRFISAEPLLGGIDLERWIGLLPADVYLDSARRIERGEPYGPGTQAEPDQGSGLHWVICGGESGPGARPCNVAWIRSIVQQCRAAGVSCFVKQLGSVIEEWKPCRESGPGTFPFFTKNKNKGGNPAEWPEDLRVREFPMPQAAV